MPYAKRRVEDLQRTSSLVIGTCWLALFIGLFIYVLLQDGRLFQSLMR